MALLSSASTRPVEPGLVSRALDVAARLADDANDVIAATAGSAARTGGGASPFEWVRDTDATLERHTRRVLATEFPGIPVLGRGTTAAKDSTAPYRWLVAPVEGAANYVAGLPWYAYSLALMDDSGPVVGVVADPCGGQTYAAARGLGVRTDDGPVRTQHRHAPEGAIVCVEPVAELPWPGMTRFALRATAAGARVRVLGSAALSVTQVALGRAGAAILPSYSESEVAGALALAVEAAAVVAESDSGLPEGSLLVCAPALAPTLLSWLRD
ncbi:inositol monophosphatase family protein [Saccharomonospora xinjiangensis]|uniref:Inositol monophosphatase/fructose-1,6-bisphosphatase family protein n=1 Tax=Saccharomonospora xinjiangensis XJ-54 TaxID=882086 RepID=I0V1F6_9PSEU|nr:inositol monophosphatase family protein [Saccharomonospora xinjiangensis]EID53959.1 inositol monophosphatase/fructose-1,6-bisphosphatase family protein [Saccharomonospora xinjiangensis XJ-54]